jgi:hypothetical protein
VGKKSDTKAKKKAGSEPICAGCKNYRASGKKKGRCVRKDKKRAADASACSHYSKAK